METYDASQIQILEGLKAVRKVPGMYIGSTDTRGLHHCVYEVVDNSIDESVAGYCSSIHLEIFEDGSIMIEDDGRGIPVEKHPKYNRPALEIVLTELHSGAKFDKRVYKITGGLHGVGVHVVNALAKRLIALVKKEDGLYYEVFKQGLPSGGLQKTTMEGLKELGDVFPKLYPRLTPDHGLTIYFEPDPEIFDSIDFSYDTLQKRMQELAFLNKQISISMADDRTGKKEELHFEGGLNEFVEYLGEGYNSLLKNPIYNFSESDDNQVEFSIQYNTGISETLQSYVNNISTVEGGTHVTGFRAGLSRAIQEYARSHDLIKGVESITGDDVREGLVAVLHVKVHSPQFEGQTKSKLGNSAVRGAVQSVTEKFMKEYLDAFPDQSAIIIKRALSAAAAREASREARDLVRRKSALESGGLPGKLADCSKTDPESCELYIVEGNSAGGTAKQARNREFQAILPLRGKILNVEKANDARALSNQEIRSLITVLGTNIKENLDIEKLRYHKIIIMTDADEDGAHIRTLLLTFFYRFAKELIQNGYIYAAQPPLYRIQKGKDVRYVYSEKDKDSTVSEMGRNAVVQRFKGLGEMNPEQLWETTMDPESRNLLQVTIEDAAIAEHLFSILMGDKVEPRKLFIEKNAKFVKNIDL